ncbi:MAG: ABC transporter substrate-binding protein [Actinomycetota bacterium]|nr:amino acid ABC transporter substrate-binding protein [Rubrobacteraceae bacterium]MBA3614591.1 amino acid ABC transporter substrate-binding protein [Rubrobacteraceae bacterium]MDQ3182087.1 ABC transporter substrate-binding protein [Actinomycetota bacterium]MDQ3497498.1 ABC transporter substrate-binding protein [Actinomycetota bacterium]
MRERIILIGLLSAVLLLVGCGGPSAESGSSDSCDMDNPPLFEKDGLTVATDKPAYPPWFKGDPKNYSGYEGDVASEIAGRMDLPIKWTVEPFNKSYAPGAKDFDFDINQITITPEREQAVDFSNGYFDNAQGVLVMKDSPAASAKSVSDLKDLTIGAQVGTTGLDFVNETIKPTADPKVYDSTNDAKSALESGQIDAIVTDLVTTVYLRDFEIDGSAVVGQYPRNEQFGMLFEQGNPLVDCVNQALGEMKSDGTLEELEQKHLQQFLDVPTLEK